MTPESQGETRANTLQRQRQGGILAERRAARAAEELPEARGKLERARERLLSAAIAFCDGSISEGQLRAVRELLREQETRVNELEGMSAAPFVQEMPAPAPAAPVPVTPTQPSPPSALVSEPSAAELKPSHAPEPREDSITGLPDIGEMLSGLERKLLRLEEDFQQGRINASQYRAIRRHYLEQRQVAVRLKQAYPESDRWRVVLEEGKTTFLMQLNEAECRSVAFYDMESRKRLFVQGDMPASAEEAMALLRTFGPAGPGAASDRMFATRMEDGSALVLIPGRFTVALVVFSQDPPAWQVRALREVHGNFEAANRAALVRGERQLLVFPDLGRFVKA